MSGSATTTDEVKRIEMSYLKQAGYLCGWTNRRISWSCRGEPSGFIQTMINTGSLDEGCYMELDYKTRRIGEGEWRPIKYRVQLVSTPCRYGGKRWWFICPYTRCQRRNSILYQHNDYFACRKCARLWYDSQKYVRPDLKPFSDLFKAEELERKMKRWYYRGRPTRKHRRYRKLTRGLGWEEQAQEFRRMEGMLLGS